MLNQPLCSQTAVNLAEKESDHPRGDYFCELPDKHPADSPADLVHQLFVGDQRVELFVSHSILRVRRIVLAGLRWAILWRWRRTEQDNDNCCADDRAEQHSEHEHLQMRVHASVPALARCVIIASAISYSCTAIRSSADRSVNNPANAWPAK